MKINNLGPTGINPYKKQINKMAAVESKASKADKVEISAEAKQLLETSPVTTARQEKVEALANRVKNGSYKIDSNAIAKSVYDFYTK